MAKKKTTKKSPKIETIKLGCKPHNTVTYNSEQYQKQPNGNYKNMVSGKEVKIIE